MRIGFIGLGSMGQPMAKNLLRAGHQLKVWNRSAGALHGMAALGAEACDRVADACQADVVISMLADDDTTRDAVVRQGELPRGAIWINMATVSVAFTHEMQHYCEQQGIRYLAAPVMGRNDVAAAGKLQILTAGDPELIAQVQPLFDVLGQKSWYFGSDPAQAMVAKLANNFMLAAAIEAMAEASAMVRAWDIPAADFFALTGSTIFACPAYTGYGELIAQEKYTPPGFKLRLGLKDVRLVAQAAEEKNVPLPLASLVRDNSLDSLAHHEGDLEWAALAKVAARRAGLE